MGIRYVYTDKVALVLDRSREGKKIRRYLPRDVVRLLRVLDREWKRRISTGHYSVAWRVATVALLGSAYGCDEMVTLYFLATRCDASLAFFTVAWLATQLLQLPSALVRAYTVQSFVGASAAVWKPNNDSPSSRRRNGGNLASMAWNLHTVEQMQLRGRRRVDGVGRPEVYFNTGWRRTTGASWAAPSGRRRSLWSSSGSWSRSWPPSRSTRCTASCSGSTRPRARVPRGRRAARNLSPASAVICLLRRMLS